MGEAIAPVEVDQDYVVRMAQELIRIPAENPPGDCSAIADKILSELRSFGVDRVETHEFETGMPNFIIQTGDDGTGGHFVIGGHMDTVPVHPDEVEDWQVGPFSGELRGGEIWGRGAADMKGALASTLGAFKALHDNKVPLAGKLTWVLLSDGEHGDQHGAQALADRGILKDLGGIAEIEYTAAGGPGGGLCHPPAAPMDKEKGRCRLSPSISITSFNLLQKKSTI